MGRIMYKWITAEIELYKKMGQLLVEPARPNFIKIIISLYTIHF